MPGIGVRVTQRSIASNVLSGLQTNISRLGDLQNKLSSGKQLNRPSDSPGDTVMAMQFRSEMANLQQYSRNADDGIGWLSVADSSLTDASTQLNRARELVLSGMSTGSFNSPDARSALADELDSIRSGILSTANSQYLDRPVFGGTTTGNIAYKDDGTYAGDHGKVERTASPNATNTVRVDTDAEQVFGKDGDPDQLFSVLSQISIDLRTNPGALETDLGHLDTATSRLQGALASVGSRYNQLTQLQSYANSRVVDLTGQVSDVEDIDLPQTITELQLQQTAYQAALSATAHVVQPSLVDFLR